VVKKWVPVTYNAFLDHRVNATTISGKGMDVVKRMIKGEKVTQEDSGMSKREWTELMAELEDEKRILLPSG
jgi:thymidylate synthase (FAD)